ncbi:MAG TPA: phosphoribosylpyrophosphate synthetase, partial [Hyphomonas sp.]|nr:phosphoribosylpyrophosphate synthetase [Hyphomonas sp.]
NWTGHQPVLVDDIASSGRTMMEAARHFKTAGFAKPVCVIVHPLFAGNAYEDLKSVSTRVVSTNAVQHASNEISITPLLVG